MKSFVFCKDACEPSGLTENKTLHNLPPNILHLNIFFLVANEKNKTYARLSCPFSCKKKALRESLALRFVHVVFAIHNTNGAG